MRGSDEGRGEAGEGARGEGEGTRHSPPSLGPRTTATPCPPSTDVQEPPSSHEWAPAPLPSPPRLRAPGKKEQSGAIGVEMRRSCERRERQGERLDSIESVEERLRGTLSDQRGEGPHRNRPDNHHHHQKGRGQRRHPLQTTPPREEEDEENLSSFEIEMRPLQPCLDCQDCGNGEDSAVRRERERKRGRRRGKARAEEDDVTSCFFFDCPQEVTSTSEARPGLEERLSSLATTLTNGQGLQKRGEELEKTDRTANSIIVLTVFLLNIGLACWFSHLFS
ncbi:uncharacterized protein LOC121305198 [Polyodon spathula]|uniref:uncharacterized protein LOC121305198 n=1 Tax=Polyodon spathula TaxID=7913 RepID=UPI001B7EEBD8|nr:uncharacterized protein LOC121305198 [Polyodon spathula]